MTCGSNRLVADAGCSARAGELDAGVRQRVRVRARWPGAAFCALSAALFVSGAAPIASAGAVDGFFGDFRGTASAFALDSRDERVLRVRIGPHEHGFVVQWEALIHEPGSAPRRREQKVHFLPTARADVYQSGMRQKSSGPAAPFGTLRRLNRIGPKRSSREADDEESPGGPAGAGGAGLARV